MVQWTSDKDAQLLLGIFEFTDIKFSKELLEHLANKIGEGCTSKAVSHRLTNMKAKGKAASAGSPAPTGTTTKNSTGKGTKTNTKSKGRGKKANADRDAGSDSMTASPSPSKKRGLSAKLSDSDELDDKTDTKRIKRELLDDVDVASEEEV